MCINVDYTHGTRSSYVHCMEKFREVKLISVDQENQNRMVHIFLQENVKGILMIYDIGLCEDAGNYFAEFFRTLSKLILSCHFPNAFKVVEVCNVFVMFSVM